jgi:hypothetical protein
VAEAWWDAKASSEEACASVLVTPAMRQLHMATYRNVRCTLICFPSRFGPCRQGAASSMSTGEAITGMPRMTGSMRETVLANGFSVNNSAFRAIGVNVALRPRRWRDFIVAKPAFGMHCWSG